MNTRYSQTTKYHARGLTLIEMMIALVVLSIGLLGIAALQTKGQYFNHDAYIRTQVTTLAYDLMDRMRANISCADDARLVTDANPLTNNPNVSPEEAGCKDVTGYQAAAAPGAAQNCDTAVCTPKQLRDYDLTQWFGMLQNPRYLPDGSGSVAWNTADNPNMYTITIQWGERGEAQKNQQVWVFRP